MNSNDLSVLIRSRVPILVIDSADETQVIKTVLRASGHEAVEGAVMVPQQRAAAGLPVFQWTVTDGLKRLDADFTAPQRTVTEPAQVLKYIRASNMAAIYILLDFHPYLSDPVIVRHLKDIAQEYSRCARTLVLVSFELTIPREVESLTARFCLALPDRAERRKIVEEIAHQWVLAHPRTIQ